MAKTRLFKRVAVLVVLIFLCLSVVAGSGGLSMTLAQSGLQEACNPTYYTTPYTGGAPAALAAVAFAAPDDGWAVGAYSGPTYSALFALHWDGKAWSPVSMPNPGFKREVFAMSAIAKDDVWAVGNYTDENSVIHTLALHWDGQTWRHVDIPLLGNLGGLTDVSGVSGNDVWATGAFYSPVAAAGRAFILHWDGTAWSPATIPELYKGDTYIHNSLQGISARTADDAWAIGNEYQPAHGKYFGGRRPIILHWDGSAWTQVPGPTLGPISWLYHVVAVAPDSVWATVLNIGPSQLIHWDGSTWSVIDSPLAASELEPYFSSLDYLASVKAFSKDDVWAIGTFGIGKESMSYSVQLLHWNGTTVEATLLPLQGNTPDAMGVAGGAITQDGKVWAVGQHFDPGFQMSVPLVVSASSKSCSAPPRPRPLNPPAPVPGSGSQTFPETGKTVSGIFLDYWRKNGGLAQQGYPISEVIGEQSELDGKIYTVQYFERAVFEYHPENRPPYNVLLSQLGTFRYREKYPNGAPGQ